MMSEAGAEDCSSGVNSSDEGAEDAGSVGGVSGRDGSVGDDSVGDGSVGSVSRSDLVVDGVE